MLTLEVIEGDRPGRLIHVASPVCEIGRDADGGVSLRGEQVRPRHATIRLERRQWVIAPLAPESATRRNGILINQATPLAIGDRLRLGDVQMVVRGASPSTANQHPGDPVINHLQTVFPHINMKAGDDRGNLTDRASETSGRNRDVGDTDQTRSHRLYDFCLSLRSWLW
jgi:pSer/pThr/pTyr-binding forkhead associated (FHA) protein